MQELRSRFALAGAALAIGAVALPATAGAAVTPIEDNGAHTLVLNSDAAADAITLSVVGGQYAFALGNAAPTVTGVDVDAAAAITVNGGDGNDNIDASALGLNQYGALTLHGDAGDDVILGGANAGIRDGVFGDDGDDRVNGFRGNDDQFGGAGNDTLVWNNLDGSDASTGDAGADTVEFNGNVIGDDAITIQPSVAIPAGKVNVHRVAGNVDIEAATVERIVVNGLGGNDSITANDGINALGLIGGLTLDGGVGDDTITGGDTVDTILGGDDNDVLSGGAGNDSIVGGRGTDTANGGAGDDVMTWFNGDATDVNNGNDGLDVTEVIEGPANDINTVTPNGARSTFARTSAVTFSINTDSEVLSLKTFAGDDSLAVGTGAGTVPSIVVDAGAGNDTLAGGSEIDTFLGNAGNDTLTGGTGVDLLDGQDGDDTLRARDAFADLVRGGAGNDNAQVDTQDAVDAVEKIDAPVVVVPDVKAFAATVTSGTVKVTRNKGRLTARVPVTCPTTEIGGCKVALTLQTASRVKVGGVRAVVLLGTKTVTLKTGQKSTVTVALTSGAAKFARKGKIAARATLWTTDAANNATSSSRRVSVVVPKAKKAKSNKK